MDEDGKKNPTPREVVLALCDAVFSALECGAMEEWSRDLDVEVGVQGEAGSWKTAVTFQGVRFDVTVTRKED